MRRLEKPVTPISFAILRSSVMSCEESFANYISVSGLSWFQSLRSPYYASVSFISGVSTSGVTSAIILWILIICHGFSIPSQSKIIAASLFLLMDD